MIYRNSGVKKPSR